MVRYVMTKPACGPVEFGGTEHWLGEAVSLPGVLRGVIVLSCGCRVEVQLDAHCLRKRCPCGSFIIQLSDYSRYAEIKACGAGKGIAYGRPKVG